MAVTGTGGGDADAIEGAPEEDPVSGRSWLEMGEA